MAIAEPTLSCLVFSAGDTWYAVSASQAAEVVTLPPLTRVPGTPRHVVGVFQHRTEVLPVVDLPTLLGRPPEGVQRAVLLRLPGGAVAVTTGEVAGVEDLGVAKEALGAQGVRALLKGPLQSPGGREVLVIDAEGLFALLSSEG